MRKELVLIQLLSIFILCNGLKKELVNKMEVAASADDIWAVYSSPHLPKLIVKLLPAVFQRIDIVEGNGGLGTVLNVTFPPGSVPIHYKEKFVTINHKKRVKNVLQIEDGYLALGCTFYMDSFHIIKKSRDRCIIKSTTRYEVPNKLAYKVEPLIKIDSLVGMAKAISKYVIDNGGRPIPPM